ncbi:MAG: AAA family ATPase [Eggerthellaceae bacterium]|nr:AAA family ATPase [Eggerthellaceae bacterium]
MTRRYLQHIYVQRYGALADCEVGPLEPGMNVVLGPNEAGKSTVSSLVGGVLFGWEDSHGVRNTYRPPEGDRAGRLQWEEPSGELSRDEDGAIGDAAVTADIDHATFDMLFALTSDELRSLHGSSDVTARLLAAGSGTSASPSSAFVEVERRLVEATSDVLSLAGELDAKRVQVKQASEQAELLLQRDRELRALAASRETTAERIEAVNAEVEDLAAHRVELETIDERAARRTAELEGLRSELAELAPRYGPLHHRAHLRQARPAPAAARLRRRPRAARPPRRVRRAARKARTRRRPREGKRRDLDRRLRSAHGALRGGRRR